MRTKIPWPRGRGAGSQAHETVAVYARATKFRLWLIESGLKAEFDNIVRENQRSSVGLVETI